MISRKKTRKIKVGNVFVGGNAPISVQSMTNTETSDIISTVRQIHSLEKAGCDIVRCAVNSFEDAEAISEIKKAVNIPIIADIQYDYKLAIEACKHGVDCLRINPGNIGGKEKVKELATAADIAGVPIRIGVNSGSLPKDLMKKCGGITSLAMVKAAERQICDLNECNFDNIKVALKSSDVRLSVESNKLFSEKYDYPLHLGITEAGPMIPGTVKSSIGIGSLLLMGIGDTLRVSLTADPVEEVRVGREILKSLGILKNEINIVSCPTCSRTGIDLIKLVNEVERMVKNYKTDLTIAIMGCPVNGPGEAKAADIGISCQKGKGYIFRKGKMIRMVEESMIISELRKEIESCMEDSCE